MAFESLLIIGVVLLLVTGLQQAARRLLRSPERRDGAPSQRLLLLSESIDIAGAMALAACVALSHGKIVTFGHLWRHDVWAALLWGGLAGSFLHLIGSGSPLPVASIREPAGRDDGPPEHTGLGQLAVFLAGELSTTMIWFGFGLPTLIRFLPRLVTLAVVAGGYGLRRQGAGQDHVLLGAVDGLLLSMLYFLTGSLVSVVLARLIADVLAYATAITRADEGALTSEGGA